MYPTKVPGSFLFRFRVNQTPNTKRLSRTNPTITPMAARPPVPTPARAEPDCKVLFPLLEAGPVGLAVGFSLGTTGNGVGGGAKVEGSVGNEAGGGADTAEGGGGDVVAGVDGEGLGGEGVSPGGEGEGLGGGGDIVVAGGEGEDSGGGGGETI